MLDVGARDVLGCGCGGVGDCVLPVLGGCVD